MISAAETMPVRGRIDPAGRLAVADPELAALHARAGGEEGGPLAIPQIAALARLARRLGTVVSRPVIAADGDLDLDLWVRAQPEGQEVALAITGWKLREPSAPTGPGARRDEDFLRAAGEWTWQTDEALHFTAISPAAAAALGKTPLDLIGKPFTRLFRPQEGDDGTLSIVSALAERRRFDNQLAELRTRGKPLFMLSGVPLVDGHGHFAGFRGSAASLPAGSDTTPDMATDSTVDRPGDGGAFAQRLEKALREPLDRIIANADTIGDQPEGPIRRDYAGYARDIAAAGRHLMELVDDLVDLQAIERSDFKPEAEEVDLADVARRTAGLLSVRAASRNVRISAPGEQENAPAVGEFRRVLQIVMNLVTNAVRYSPEGDTVKIGVQTEGSEVRLIVSDAGRGIAIEDQDRIFDKFERVDVTEPGGTGLGLYIARRLARAMDGDLAVKSEPGEGACFTLSLPRWQ